MTGSREKKGARSKEKKGELTAPREKMKGARFKGKRVE